MIKFFLTAYLNDTRGATAIEYVLIAAGISLAIMAVVYAFGEDLAALYEDLEGVLDG
ncbi:MAG: Flp family type IVb pilin [Alphaproteobacteria bacterium]|nr:Flp family type IVb pilin [Alphaproteobacteria bacterium]